MKSDQSYALERRSGTALPGREPRVRRAGAAPLARLLTIRTEVKVLVRTRYGRTRSCFAYWEVWQ
jgi:hypothetical protein